MKLVVITILQVTVPLLLVCALVLWLTSRPAQATDATAAWDAAAASYNFKTSAQVGSFDTFAHAWAPTSFPASFEADLAAIVAHVGGVCGGPIAPPDGDEVMIATLQNWN
jgi:hypothetical protein